MTARITALGYLRLRATDLDLWEEFGQRVLGLMADRRSDDRLLFRIDEKAYRLEVRPSDQGGVDAVGWETKGPAELAELEDRLTAAGYSVTRPGPEVAQERMVSDLIRFRDPDDCYDHEIFWGLSTSSARFASPIGAEFVAGVEGVGHVLQVVQDRDVYEALFCDVLGFRLSDHIDLAPGLAATFLHCNPRHHSFAFTPQIPGRPLGVGHFMLEVTDLDVIGRALEHIEDDPARLLKTFGRHSNDRMTSFYLVTPSDVGLEFGTGGIKIDDETWTPTRYDTAHLWGHHSVDHH
ncbi:VOC family protein [Nocardioides pacificus]